MDIWFEGGDALPDDFELRSSGHGDPHEAIEIGIGVLRKWADTSSAREKLCQKILYRTGLPSLPSGRYGCFALNFLDIPPAYGSSDFFREETSFVSLGMVRPDSSVLRGLHGVDVQEDFRVGANRDTLAAMNIPKASRYYFNSCDLSANFADVVEAAIVGFRKAQKKSGEIYSLEADRCRFSPVLPGNLLEIASLGIEAEVEITRSDLPGRALDEIALAILQKRYDIPEDVRLRIKTATDFAYADEFPDEYTKTCVDFLFEMCRDRGSARDNLYMRLGKAVAPSIEIYPHHDSGFSLHTKGLKW